MVEPGPNILEHTMRYCGKRIQWNERTEQGMVGVEMSGEEMIGKMCWDMYWEVYWAEMLRLLNELELLEHRSWRGGQAAEVGG